MNAKPGVPAIVASRASFSAKKGATLTFTATLTDPNGKPIAGQAVAFTVTLAGVPPDIQIRTTNAAGVATLKETIGAHAADLQPASPAP